MLKCNNGNPFPTAMSWKQGGFTLPENSHLFPISDVKKNSRP